MGQTAVHAGPAQRICALSPLVASQIAAGEVVERPASVVKELVENSLDAGASRVTVELERGGVELIRVTDDGCGIPAEDLPLALAPHATSKVRTSDDLVRIATLGFRGEAVASIASVSRLSIRSRTADQPGASLIEAEGDSIGPVQPAPGPPGTSITVRNLFFNTPARRKFLRTERTEQGRCAEVLDAIAMARPAVGFKLVVDGRVSVDLPPDQSPRERIGGVMGRELNSQLLEAHADEIDAPGPEGSRGLSLYGLVGLPAIARATAQAQHIFVNGRPVKDRTVMHALREAYRGLIEPSRYPTAILLIEMDPAMVDVNVHPAKTEVRFRDSSLVHSAVLRAVRDALRSADLTPTAGGGQRPWAGEGRAILPGGGMQTGGGGSGGGGHSPFVDYFRRAAPAGAPTRLSYDALRRALNEPAAPDAPNISGDDFPESSDVGNGAAPTDSSPFGSEAPEASLPMPEPASPILQVHKSYLVTQDAQGVVIIDQHALHERAMFELLLARIAMADLESQRLLVPATVEASAAHIDRLPLLAPLFKRLGIEAEPMGPSTIAVHAFPTFLFDKGVEPASLLAELLEKSAADDFEPSSEETLRDILDMMSCKAAVKAGDQMSAVELADLVRLREEIERSSNCPHGRPTSIRVTIRDLEKLFGRA
jgi:DNA mismatch repair protein MutL